MAEPAQLTGAAVFVRMIVAARGERWSGTMEQAEMAELADARGSGPRTRKGVEVRVLFSAPEIEVQASTSPERFAVGAFLHGKPCEVRTVG